MRPEYHYIAAAQAAGNVVAVVLRQPLDIAALLGMGGRPTKLLVSSPNSHEQELDTVEALVRSGAIQVLVASAGALVRPEDQERVSRLFRRADYLGVTLLLLPMARESTEK